MSEGKELLSTDDLHSTVLMDILHSVIKTPRPENLFESQKVELKEEIFQKYPHQHGLSLQNTENDFDKFYITLVVMLSLCIFLLFFL